MQTLSNTGVMPRDVRWYQMFAAELAGTRDMNDLFSNRIVSQVPATIEKYSTMGLQRAVLERIVKEVFGIVELGRSPDLSPSPSPSPFKGEGMKVRGWSPAATATLPAQPTGMAA